MLKDKSESVKVIVRCRPLVQRKMKDQHECMVSVDMKNCIIAVILRCKRNKIIYI